jgi:hypothetical protein
MVCHNNAGHGFTDGNNARDDRNIVPSADGDPSGLSGAVDGILFFADRSDGFTAHADDDFFPGGNAGQDAPGVVGEKTVRPDRIIVFGPLKTRRPEAGPDLDSLYRADAHESFGKVGIHFVKDRLPQTRGASLNPDLHDPSHGVPHFFHPLKLLHHFCGSVGIRAKERIFVDFAEQLPCGNRRFWCSLPNAFPRVFLATAAAPGRGFLAEAHPPR